MANPEHVEILKQGVDVWNAWREENLDVQPDLTDVDLSGACLSQARLSNASLNFANLARADLTSANLILADLIGANLREADLRESVLVTAKFIEANLLGANLSETIIGYTTFGKIDLSETKGLDNIQHGTPSILGMRTIKKSKGRIPEVFLRGCGLSDYEIKVAKLWRKGMDRNEVTNIAYDLVKLYCGDGLQFYSCFISYNNADEAFARKLHDDLQDNGVRCWFAPEDMKIGDRIRPRIDQEIRLRDKLLVILSENSVDSEWVGDEVEAALEEERMDGRKILFPIRLDDAVMETRLDWAAKIRRRRHIGDFTGWQEEAQYQQGFQRLLRDLKAVGDS
jgi:hypothetical protein